MVALNCFGVSAHAADASSAKSSQDHGAALIRHRIRRATIAYCIELVPTSCWYLIKSRTYENSARKRPYPTRESLKLNKVPLVRAPLEFSQITLHFLNLIGNTPLDGTLRFLYISLYILGETPCTSLYLK